MSRENGRWLELALVQERQVFILQIEVFWVVTPCNVVVGY